MVDMNGYSNEERVEQLTTLARLCAEVAVILDEHHSWEAGAFADASTAAAGLATREFEQSDLNELSRRFPITPDWMHPKLLDGRPLKGWHGQVAPMVDQVNSTALDLRAIKPLVSNEIRPFDFDKDSVAQLTDLLHEAYADHAAEGRQFFATYQTVDDTRRRMSKGECWVVTYDADIIGTVTVEFPFNAPDGYPSSPNAGTFAQLAVKPKLRGTGLGNQLLSHAEERIAVLGGDCVVIDTSTLAENLIRWYRKRGYSAIGTWRWSVTNYESVVLRKQLLEPGVQPL